MQHTSAADNATAMAVAVAAVVLVLGAATLGSPGLLAVALATCAVIIAWGWAGALALPSPRGTLTVLLLGGLGLVGAVAARPGQPWLAWLPIMLALAMLGAFVHQLLRKDGRPRVVESVSSVVLALAVVCTGVLLLAPAHTREGVALVLGALAAALASSLTDLLGRYAALRPWLTALAMVGGAGAAIVVALLLDVQVSTWLLVGVAAGALSHAARAVLAPLATMAHPRPRLVAAVTSVLVAGVVPYLVGSAFLPTSLAG